MTTIDHQPAQPVADDWDWQLSAACRGMDVETFGNFRHGDASSRITGTMRRFPPDFSGSFGARFQRHAPSAFSISAKCQ